MNLKDLQIYSIFLRQNINISLQINSMIGHALHIILFILIIIYPDIINIKHYDCYVIRIVYI